MLQLQLSVISTASNKIFQIFSSSVVIIDKEKSIGYETNHVIKSSHDVRLYME